MNFKSKVIEGLTYGFVGSLGVNDGISHGVWSIDYDASVELPADYEEIAKREIFEYQHEQHLLEVKQRKDKFDMEKFGRTF